jgi:prepilin-type N-terminal cleavage/methylation domain-containing protein
MGSDLAQRRHLRGSDAGFTLVEVIVALALVGIIATAALSMVVQGLKGSTHLQHTQVATTVANQAMEQVRAVNAVTPAGATATNLVKGRFLAAVQLQWTAAGHPDETTTYPASDVTANAASTPVIPLSTTSTVGNQTYAVTTLIGTCYRTKTAPTTSACTRPTSTEPVGNTTYVPLVRVMIEVSWTPTGASSCPASGCVYRLSSLVDATKDSTWLAGANLQAVNDTAPTTVAPGGSVTVNVLANDTGQKAAVNPVSIAAAPSSGSATAAPNGSVTYTAAASGTVGSRRTVVFPYRFTNGQGATSNNALVTVVVRPPVAGGVSFDMPASASPATVDLGLLARAAHTDDDARVRIAQALTGQPSSSTGTLAVDGAPGTVGAMGTTVTLTPKASSIGTYTFQHTVTSGGDASAVATSSIRVLPVGATYARSAPQGSARVLAARLDREVPALSTGQTEVDSFSFPSNCGQLEVLGIDLYWTPPNRTATCVLSFEVRGTTTSTQPLRATSTITLTATP